jgi:16S rRNA (cytosine967-C5)-methyltransferase
MSAGWKSRTAVINILRKFEEDGKLKVHVDSISKGFNHQDRAFIRELSVGIVRNLKLIDFCVQKVLKKPLKQQPSVQRNALRLIFYQLKFTGIPSYAVLNETVEAVKKVSDEKSAGFVNAVGRKLLNFDCQKHINAIRSKIKRFCLVQSFEEWMFKRWLKFYGNESYEIAESLNKNAPLFLRVNTLKIDEKEFKRILNERNIEWEESSISPLVVRIKGRVVIEELPGYDRGYFYIQDPASFYSVLLLSPKPKERILEIASAPGGKTTAIAQLVKNACEIVAVDVSEERIEILKENCKKLGVENVVPVVTDITEDLDFLRKNRHSFDRILIDAPCSGTGVIRRHPEGKWNKSEEFIKRCSELQKKMLKCARSLVKPNGIVVYSVCSLEREEGEEIKELAEEISFKVLTSERLFPHRHNTDGFYYLKVRPLH